MDIREERKRLRQKKERQAKLLFCLVIILAVIAIGLFIAFKIGLFSVFNKEIALIDSKTASELESAIGSQSDEDSIVEIQISNEVDMDDFVPEESITVQTKEEKYEEALNEMIDAYMEDMSLEEKVAGIFFVTPEAVTGVNTAIKAGDQTKTALEKYPVGGLIYFRKNIVSGQQLQEMLQKTAEYSKYPVFLGVDEEGGKISRVAGAGLANQEKSPEEIAKSNDIQTAYEAGRNIAAYLSEIGFNMDFAPVADLNSVENSAIGSRSFGSDAETVSGFVSMMMKGLNENGVTACVKHFPGTGNTSQDTEKGMAVTEQSKEEFEEKEFAVFRKAVEEGAQMMMVDHVSAPALTGDNTPCSLSSAVVTDILRNELGFDGIIISDALNMPAVSDYYGSEEAAIMALRAGCDMVLMPEDFVKAYEGVLNAIQNGQISENRINDAIRRIYRVKLADKVVIE